ncbi:MAG: tetratricopeptide repeat protein [Bacteroidota bacterium]
MTLHPRDVVLVIAALVCLALAVAMGSFAYYSNESFGFPLDDPWIHLQFAENLAEHGAFSYYKDELVTSGSTAPFYTLLLAAGLLVTDNEMVLSYVIGVLMFLVAIFLFLRTAEHSFRGRSWLAFGGVFLLAMEPRLHWAALSGMETTLFVALLLAVFHSYTGRKPVALGISAGLLLWTRPEAVILFGALIADLAFKAFFANRTEKRGFDEYSWLVKSAVIVLLLGAGYALFNFVLSGSLLPNTYAAKLKYYSGTGRNFPVEVFRYLTDGHLILLAPFCGVGMVLTIFQLARGKHSVGIIPLLFVIGMFLAYWIKLPYMYQNGRYLMPVLPFYLFLGLVGIDWLITKGIGFLKFSVKEKLIPRIGLALLGIIAIQFGYGTWKERSSYQESCKYISDRQVKTAHWIREHLPETAVIATHDVGAIAYYSQRKIVDMVGLITPEMIPRIGNLELLKGFLREQHVTHLALLRNWFEVVNVNPLFQTNELTPEIMEVFAFEPDRTHFTTSQVAWLTSTGWYYLARGDVRQGGPLVEKAVQLDSLSSRAHHHFGWALSLAGQIDRAEEEFRKSIDLHPSYWQAHFALAQVPLRRQQPAEAITRLQKLLAANPDMLAVYQSIAQIYGQMGDTTKARRSLEQFQREMEMRAKREGEKPYSGLPR